MLKKIINGIVILAVFLLVFCKKDSSFVDISDIEGDYIFVEKFIYSYAKEMIGHCDIGIAFQPHTIYSYDSLEKTLVYKLRPEFNINNDLKIIIATRHVFASLAGPYSTEMSLTPIYSDSVHGIYLIKDSIIEFDLNFKTIQEKITLPADSTITRVLKTIENGIVEPSLGDTCIWEYTDSLVITNYGLNPKSKIIHEPIP
jgi:signal peptidase I